MDANTINLHVVGARRYSFTDRDSGRLVEGLNIFYLTDESQNNDSIGLVPAKVVLPYHYFDKVKQFQFPAICKATLTQTLTAKGVKTSVTDLDFIKKADSK